MLKVKVWLNLHLWENMGTSDEWRICWKCNQLPNLISRVMTDLIPLTNYILAAWFDQFRLKLLYCIINWRSIISGPVKWKPSAWCTANCRLCEIPAALQWLTDSDSVLLGAVVKKDWSCHMSRALGLNVFLSDAETERLAWRASMPAMTLTSNDVPRLFLLSFSCSSLLHSVLFPLITQPGHWVRS